MIYGINDLEPGDIGFGPIKGWIGLGVGVGQVLLGDDEPRHVFVVTSGSYVAGPILPARPPMCVEAMPSGARRIELTDERWTDDYCYLRATHWPEKVRQRIAHHAIRMLGTPYSWSNYLALALHHWRIRPGWLKSYISAQTPAGFPKRAICSVLADWAITRALREAHRPHGSAIPRGVFEDGRIAQDVTPGALYRQLLTLGWRITVPREKLI